MRRQFSILAITLAITWLGVPGCKPQDPLYFGSGNGGGELAHYVGVATDIEYPTAEVASLDEVEKAKAPLTLDNPKPEEMWDLTLEDAMRIGLTNSTILRNLGGVAFGATTTQGVPTSLLQSPTAAASTFLPAMQEADPRGGVEAALSAFDTQWTTSVFWEHNITPQNAVTSELLGTPNILLQDVSTFQTQLSRTAATGGTFYLRQNVGYEKDNTLLYTESYSSRKWTAAWTTTFEAEIRQPLLQGAGVQFNRIAGPSATPGINNGVMVARIRTDLSLADFEASVRNMVYDLERAYWNLSYAYRQLDSVIAGRNSSLQTWRQVKAKFDIGAKGGGAQEEAQARQQYFLFRSSVEQAQSNVYKTESILRYMMGLAQSDGRLVRPADEPTTAKVEFEWHDTHCEALVRSVELRRQRWRVKQAELEMIAAKNYLLPQLNAIARYGWQGVGQDLINTDRQSDADGTVNSAFASMTSGAFPEWHLGLEARVPIGFRREMAGVRYAQLAITRERKVLQEQELELSHQLGDGFRDLSQYYALSQTNFNRRAAAVREVEAVQAAYDQGTSTLDLLLDAQRRLAEAESQYYRSVVDYNVGISTVHLRKGSLLEYNGVHLTEGIWPGKAYFDARRLARARDAAQYIDYGFTQPKVISRGPYAQEANSEGISPSGGPLPPDMKMELGTPTPADMRVDPKVDPKMEPKADRKAAPEPVTAPKPMPAEPTRGTRPERTVPEPKDSASIGAGRKKHDLGALNLTALAVKDEASGPVGESSAVRSVSYQQGVTPDSVQDRMWNTRSSNPNETRQDMPAVSTDSSASGWKGLQR